MAKYTPLPRIEGKKKKDPQRKCLAEEARSTPFTFLFYISLLTSLPKKNGKKQGFDVDGQALAACARRKKSTASLFRVLPLSRPLLPQINPSQCQSYNHVSTSTKFFGFIVSWKMARWLSWKSNPLAESRLPKKDVCHAFKNKSEPAKWQSWRSVKFCESGSFRNHLFRLNGLPAIVLDSSNKSRRIGCKLQSSKLRSRFSLEISCSIQL